VADSAILAAGGAATPISYIVPGSTSIRIKQIHVKYVDNGAGGDWLPAVRIVSDSAHVMGTAADQGVKVTAGSDADVSFFPWRRVKTPCPPCTFGIVNCGGASAGPIATGTGDTTLTLTLSRAVACAGTLHIVAAGVTIGSAFADVASIVNSVTDSHGFSYDFGDSGEAQIGSIGQQSNVSTDRLIVGPTAVRVCAAGDMHVGDTITVGFHSDFPADFHSVGMAFVLEHTLLPAVESAFDGTVRYADGDSFDGIGVTANRLSWQDDGFTVRPASVAGMIATNASYPPKGPFSPGGSTLLGEVSGALDLAFTVLDHCVVGVEQEPGGDWSGAAEALAGNFQFITLTGA
jgi:hypothetical protein